MTKRELFKLVEEQYDLYQHSRIGWEALVEALLGLSEQYRKAHPVTSSGITVEDDAGHMKDGMEK